MRTPALSTGSNLPSPNPVSRRGQHCVTLDSQSVYLPRSLSDGLSFLFLLSLGGLHASFPEFCIRCNTVALRVPPPSFRTRRRRQNITPRAREHFWRAAATHANLASVREHIYLHISGSRAVRREKLGIVSSGQSQDGHQTQIEGLTPSLGQPEVENNPLVVVARNTFNKCVRVKRSNSSGLKIWCT